MLHGIPMNIMNDPHLSICVVSFPDIQNEVMNDFYIVTHHSKSTQHTELIWTEVKQGLTRKLDPFLSLISVIATKRINNAGLKHWNNEQTSHMPFSFCLSVYSLCNTKLTPIQLAGNSITQLKLNCMNDSPNLDLMEICPNACHKKQSSTLISF